MSKERKTGGPIYPDLNLGIAQRSFLMVFREMGSITKALRACKLSNKTHHYWIRDGSNKDDYRKAFDRAQDESATILEDEAFHRAVHGELEQVFYKGKVVGHHVRKSDGLLTVLLKARRPEVFAERSKVEHSGGFTLQDMNAELERRYALRDAEPATDL